MPEQVFEYPEELLRAFSLPEEHPVRQSIFWILDEAAQADVNLITLPEANDSERHFCAGRLAAIQDLHSEFKSIFESANRNNAEIGVDT